MLQGLQVRQRAALLRMTGDLAARPYLERALAIRERALGRSTRAPPRASRTWRCSMPPRASSLRPLP